MSGHLVNHIHHSELNNDNTLHVIGVVSNPARWHSRYRLFRKWRDEMLKTPNVKLYVVEGVYGDHKPECAPEPGQDYGYMCIKLENEMWLKENMINIGVNNLFPSNWKYMAWCDTDIHFRNHDWAAGTIRALQTYNVVQPWSHGVAILSDGTARTPINASFGFLHANGKKKSWGHHKANEGYEYAHSGYVWACNRYFWENIDRKLIDFCLIGSADHHIAWGLLDMVKDTVHGSMSQEYKDMVQDFATKSHRATGGGMIGYVPGIVEHGHHGPLRGRDYGGRWGILIDIDLHPKRDLVYDGQGVLHYVGAFKNKFMQRMISYNRTRNEDSIEA